MNKYSQAIINYLQKRDFELEKRKHNFIILDIENKQVQKTFSKLLETNEQNNGELFSEDNITICNLEKEPSIVNWEDNQHLYDILYAQKAIKQQVEMIDLENKK